MIVGVVPELSNLRVAQDDVVVTHHDILNVTRDLRESSGFEDVLRQKCDAVHPDMIFRAGQFHDVVTACTKVTST